jgi:hypothetical protein
MPVFLLPLVAGGYYYYKSMRENSGSQDEEPPQPRTRHTPTEGDTLDLANSSIEVSLVPETEANERTAILGDDDTLAKNRSPLLHRKGSTDTAQTEVSEVEEQIEVEESGNIHSGILGAATCCSDGTLMEIVECGNNLERRISLVFSS